MLAFAMQPVSTGTCVTWPGQVQGQVQGQVEGEGARRSGYSYGYAVSINSYGKARTNFGGVAVYRDPNLDRQSETGPFDHGFL